MYCTAFDSMNYLTGSRFTMSGTVLPGYEPVREVFESNFRANLESRAQLCVYVDQEKVVGEKSKFLLLKLDYIDYKVVFTLYCKDLVGTRYKKDEFGPDSLVPVFSTSKVMYECPSPLTHCHCLERYNQNHVWTN